MPSKEKAKMKPGGKAAGDKKLKKARKKSYDKGFVDGSEHGLAIGRAIGIAEATGRLQELLRCTLIEDLDLTNRSYLGLKRNNINTFGDLFDLNETELGSLINVTQTAVDEIKKKLAKRNLCLKA